MRKILSIICTGILCASCVSTPVPPSHREILQSTVSMTARLDKLARPLLREGADLCGDFIGNDGITTHNLIDYPENYRPVAKSLWGFDMGDLSMGGLDADEKILFVRAASAAETSGLKFGDTVDVDELAKLAKLNTDCAYDLRVRIDPRPNAYADGENIFVTTGLLENIDDLPLSLIIAHELAHNVLGHVGMEISQGNEQAADRWAVFLLARAKLDYKQAVLDPLSIGKNEDVDKRASAFKKAIAEIEKLREQGASLNP